MTRATEGDSPTALPVLECPEVLLGGPSELMRFRVVLLWLSWGVELKTLRRSASEGPEVISGGGGAWLEPFGGDGALEATKAGDWGPLPVFPDGARELVETTEPEPDVMRLGLRSGVPLAYMNLLASGSEFEAAKGGENGAEAATLGLAFEGRLSPLA